MVSFHLWTHQSFFSFAYSHITVFSVLKWTFHCLFPAIYSYFFHASLFFSHLHKKVWSNFIWLLLIPHLPFILLSTVNWLLPSLNLLKLANFQIRHSFQPSCHSTYLGLLIVLSQSLLETPFPQVSVLSFPISLFLSFSQPHIIFSELLGLFAFSQHEDDGLGPCFFSVTLNANNFLDPQIPHW